MQEFMSVIFVPAMTNQMRAIKKKGRDISSLSKHRKAFSGFELRPTAWTLVGVRRRVCGSVGAPSSRCSAGTNSSLQNPPPIIASWCSATQSVSYLGSFFLFFFLVSPLFWSRNQRKPPLAGGRSNRSGLKNRVSNKKRRKEKENHAAIAL